MITNVNICFLSLYFCFLKLCFSPIRLELDYILVCFHYLITNKESEHYLLTKETIAPREKSTKFDLGRKCRHYSSVVN